MKLFRLFTFALAILLGFSSTSFGQGNWSGDLEIRQNFYYRDTNIVGTNPPPQYDKQKTSTEGWLNIRYNNNEKGLTLGARFDLFNNSGLRNPQDAYTNQGLGFWYVKKQIDKLELTGGSFYDQFGSGITFRAYEARGQNLDYAIQGLRAKYHINDNWTMRAFAGRQKNRFEYYNPVIKGFCTEGFLSLGERFTISPGASVVNRTLDDNSMALIVSNINSYPNLDSRFEPKFNAYAYSFFGTINLGDFSLYSEYAGKTQEAQSNNLGTAKDSLINVQGEVIYNSLSYSKPGFGITLQHKITDRFDYRITPLEKLNDGIISFIPAMTRVNSYRLTSRYLPATQLTGEEAIQADVVLSLGKKVKLLFNFSDIVMPGGKLLSGEDDQSRLFREYYLESKVKFSKKFKGVFGLQRVVYNQEFYEEKPAKPLVKTFTPFAELTYKFNRKTSLRVELSNMFLDKKSDLGSWVWGMAELNFAPKYSIAIMDMYNYGNKVEAKQLHYWTAFGVANLGKNRFTMGYVKQVQGVICTGGVCRVEPAFNGLRATLTSYF